MSALINNYILPSWSVAASVKAYSSTRMGGVGNEPYQGMNLGLHVGDDLEVVKRNRRLLATELKLPSEPVWLEQVHGVEVIHATTKTTDVPCADAAWTDQRGCVLSIMTADCLPVLFASQDGSVVAAAHAGWRGLAAGVLQNTVAQLPVAAAELNAWLGPAIGANHFEVGGDVVSAFCDTDAGYVSCFKPSPTSSGKYYADIFAMGRRCLELIGVKNVCGGDHCTVTDEKLFFSYRRDRGNTGRMASLIWID